MSCIRVDSGVAPPFPAGGSLRPLVDAEIGPTGRSQHDKPSSYLGFRVCVALAGSVPPAELPVQEE